MAIEEHDREDLLRDGRMMPIRGEATIDEFVVLLGFRRQGQLSLYFGADRVFQFDVSGQLRRVYLDGHRYAADTGRLVELRRDTRGGRVELSRQPIDNTAALQIRQVLRECLDKIQQSIESKSAQWNVVGADAEQFALRVNDWFSKLPEPIQFASSAQA